MVSFTFRDSAFDAAPYSLNGQPSDKPGYSQYRWGLSVGGPLVLGKLVKSPETFFFINYFGTRAENPFRGVATVPTLAERSGDFSDLGSVLFDPRRDRCQGLGTAEPSLGPAQAQQADLILLMEGNISPLGMLILPDENFRELVEAMEQELGEVVERYQVPASRKTSRRAGQPADGHAYGSHYPVACRVSAGSLMPLPISLYNGRMLTSLKKTRALSSWFCSPI